MRKRTKFGTYEYNYHNDVTEKKVGKWISAFNRKRKSCV